MGPVGVSMTSTPAATKSSSYFRLVSIRAAHEKSSLHGWIFLTLYPCYTPADEKIPSGMSSFKKITGVGTRNPVLLMAARPAAEDEGFQHAQWWKGLTDAHVVDVVHRREAGLIKRVRDGTQHLLLDKRAGRLVEQLHVADVVIVPIEIPALQHFSYKQT